MLYQIVLVLHVSAVALSISLFSVRAVAAIRGAKWPYILRVRRISYAIDTLLLIAAVCLVALLPGDVFSNNWLTVKLCLLVAYIGFGIRVMRVNGTFQSRLVCLACAWLAVILIVGIAIAHDPRGWILLANPG